MSYSRWSDSNWYTFWYSDSGPKRIEQELACWYAGTEATPTVKFGNGDVNKLLASVREQMGAEAADVTDADWAELKGYVREWVAEVEAEYPKRGKERGAKP